MDELLKRRRVLKAKLTRVKTVVDSNEQEPLDTFQIHVQLEILDTTAQEIRELERDIFLACDEEDFDIHEQELSGMMTRFSALKTSLLRLSNALERQSANRATSTQNTPRSSLGRPLGPAPPASAEVKLPRLELPTFSGKLTEWPSFHDRFCAAVHNRTDLAGSTKLQFLMSCLSGDAADLLQAMTVSDDNYTEAWDLLTTRYKNNREIALAHLKRLHDQPVVPAGSSAALRKMVDTTNECFRSLKVLGVPVAGWDLEIFYVLSTKLEGEVKKQWELTYRDDSFPKLSEFLSFLERHAKANAASEMTQTSSKSKTQTDYLKPSVSASKLNTCLCCSDGDQRLHQCTKFLRMPVPEKRKFVQARSLCFNCMRPGHSSDLCPSENCCKKCSSKHHTLLHSDSDSLSSFAATLDAPTTIHEDPQDARNVFQSAWGMEDNG